MPYFRTKIVSYNEPLDEIELFIYLSNHAIRYIHEISIGWCVFIAEVEGVTVAIAVDDPKVS